jgi:hypothetical protein
MNNICGIMIYPFGSLNVKKVKEMLGTSVSNLQVVEDDTQAMETL